MSWNEVDNKLKKYIDSYFVSCEEPYERQTIKRVIKEEFPHLSGTTIEAAIEDCCREIKAPRSREAFMQCLRRRLGV